MLVYNSKMTGTPVLSVQTGAPVGFVKDLIIDPDDLKVLAFRLDGPLVAKSSTNLLITNSIREYSKLGMVIDDIDELVAPDDVVRLQKILELNFDLIGLKAKTKKGTKLGVIADFTLTPEDFVVQQIIVKRPTIKALLDPELTISRNEIVEINDYEVIIRDEESVLKKRAEKEDFVPNFVNPFREKQPGFAPADIKKSKD